MTDPSKPNPQDHIRQLDAMQQAAPNGPLWAALDWALPLLRAMHEPPPNPHGLDMIGILEGQTAEGYGPSKWEHDRMVEWASPILRSYVARKRTIPATANTPAANIANMRLMAEGKAVPWDLAQAALDWALPILEASMATEEERKESMAWLARMANRPIGYTAPMTEEWVQQFAKAISLLRAPTPSGLTFSEATNSTRFSCQERQEIADWLRTVTDDPKMPESTLRIYNRAIAMILAPAHERWTEPEAIRQREELARGRNAAREIGRLSEFILEKFPGELDGLSPVTVAIRLLNNLHQIRSFLTDRRSDVLTAFSGETEHPIAASVILLLQGETTTRPTMKDSGMRLPTLDASQIPVTRDLALEVLRGFLATMQRAYPYAPSPSLEQWATAREALIFVLADEKSREKCADSNCDRTTSPFCSDHDADLRRELATDDSIIARSFIDPIRMLEALMNYMADSALTTDKEWASKIEWAIQKFSEEYMKRCRPGTMNMTAERCNACTAPCGTVHLPIQDAPTEGERWLRDQYLNQRDKAWGELRKIRDMLGLKTCKEIEAKIRVLQRDIVDMASDPPRQKEKLQKEAARQDHRIAQVQETIVAMAHQERAIASVASNLESVRLAALGKLGLLDSISIMLDGM